MVETTFGSLIVHARRSTGASSSADPPAEGGEAVGGRGVGPPALGGHPPRRGEVVEGDDRVEAGGEQRLALAPVVVDGGRSTTRPPRARCGSTRWRTGSRSSPRSTHRATSSGQRCHESQASPDGSTQPEPSVCSHAHQSLFQLPPSIWWAAVAVPHRNPSGKAVQTCAAGTPAR